LLQHADEATYSRACTQIEVNPSQSKIASGNGRVLNDTCMNAEQEIKNMRKRLATRMASMKSDTYQH